MSNYKNPLDEFRSHSYHFILTLANSTEAHRKMIDKDAFLGSVNSTKIGGKIDLSGDAAYLLIDTRRFSQFSITEFETTQIYGSGPVSNPSVASSFMRMKVVDTTGLTFFNFVMDIMKNKIQSTRASAFFMLAIVFVGHTDHDTTETVATCFIPMIMMKMGFEFTSSGSVYDLEFQETEGNSAETIPGMIDLGDIRAISTEGRSNTVGAMIQSLEDSLNLKSVKFFQKYTNKAFLGADKSVQDEMASGAKAAGKLVQYMITIPEEWKNFAINTAGKSKNVEQTFLAKEEAAITKKEQLNQAVIDAQEAGADAAEITQIQQARDSYRAFSPETSIHDAINIILDSSLEYLRLGSQANRLAGTAVVHKTSTCVTSDQTSYVMHIDVNPYRAPKVEIDSTTGKEKNVINRSENVKRLSDGNIKNLITYDYIFSGRNTDVLDLKILYHPFWAPAAMDMDLDLGPKRFASNSEKGGQSEKDVAATSGGTNKTRDFNPLIRPGEPIFVPVKTAEQHKNFSTIQSEEMSKPQALAASKAKQEHVSTLAVLHFVGSLESDLTVRGNPNLFRKYADRNTRGGIPTHSLSMTAEILKDLTTSKTDVDTFFKNDLKNKVTGGKESYFRDYIKPRHDDVLTSGTDPLLDGTDISVGPVYVKINIYAPNVDFEGNQMPGPDAPMFTNSFFYNGVYMIIGITHSFNNGTFNHTMSLIPQDLDGSFTNSGVSDAPTPTGKKIV